jgi:hypothetical protein
MIFVVLLPVPPAPESTITGSSIIKSELMQVSMDRCLRPGATFLVCPVFGSSRGQRIEQGLYVQHPAEYSRQRMYVKSPNLRHRRVVDGKRVFNEWITCCTVRLLCIELRDRAILSTRLHLSIKDATLDFEDEAVCMA